MSAASRIYKVEDLQKLHNFNLDTEVTAENFVRVVYAYQIEGEIMSCNLLRVKRKCNTKHNLGYVIELKDGQLSVIGKDCAKKHFSNNAEIIQAIKTFDKQLDIKEKLQVIYTYIHNYSHLLESLNTAKDNTIQSFKNLREIRKYLGSYNCFLLENRFKSGRNNINVKAYKLTKKYEEIYQATHSIGNIPSLNIFNLSLDDQEYLARFDRFLKALKRAKRLELQLSNKSKKLTDKGLDFDIKEINERLKHLHQFIKESEELKLDLERFLHSDLNLLCYLSYDYEDQKKAAEFIIAMNSLKNIEPNVYLRTLEINLATKFKCHLIKSDD